MKIKDRIVVVLGPTASGKTDLGIKLAKKFNGEVISADSRQIYTKMLIGTAKPAGTWQMYEGEKRYLVEGVPHYLMDIIDPGKTFSVAEFKERALGHIKDIINRGKLPVIVGGTGLYIWSVVDNLQIPPGHPNKKLRDSFEKKTCEELAMLLSAIDPNAAMVDQKNKRRLIRALEVTITTGESFATQRSKTDGDYDVLQIGLNWPVEELYERIGRRIDMQWKQGLVGEVENLLTKKYIFDLPSMSSIGYRQVGYYLRGEVSENEAIEWFKKDTRRYAKRQLTWFRKDKRIKWIERSSEAEAVDLVEKFLRNKKTS